MVHVSVFRSFYLNINAFNIMFFFVKLAIPAREKLSPKEENKLSL